MTNVRLHGILAKEYGHNFCLDVGRSKNVLHAIDANRDNFIARVIQLQKEGCVYEVIIDKERLGDQQGLRNADSPKTIDLVPAITGSGPVIGWLVGGTLLANLTLGVMFSVISYALTPAPEVERVEATAQASKQSQIFSSAENVASQGAPLPLGYGRLKVGSQVIQSSIKSYPQHQRVGQVFNTQAGTTIITSQGA
jgi:predicted phage tail protein